MEAEEYFSNGYDKLMSEQYEEGIKDFNKVLELDKDNERAYVHRAACKFGLGNYKGALADFQTAMFKNPNDPLTFLNAGYTLYKLDKNTTDVSYLNLAIKKDSENIPEAHYIRGMIYYKNKHYHSAIEDFSKAIKADYCTEICYFKRGQCYSNLDKYDEAIADYTRAINLDSLNADNYYYRAGCYFCQQRYANALSDLNTALNLAQEESYYYVRALVYDSLDKYDKALADYKKVKELDPAYDEIDEHIQDTNRKLTLRLVKQ